MRWLLGAPQGIANEKLYMDSGMLGLEHQLALRSLNYRLKLEGEAKKGTMLGNLYLMNKQKGLTWVRTCSRWTDLVNFSGLR
ncbi:unnamed protein product [Blepharisma stoltei]|uniref:Uncharacterized protein n=1 Tax=Blepharisma stoltei TaxID=1481888 RepID=A0AAU9IKA3_9CILI|nr:unnamed protein product [Blepharisma stoltei]